MCEHILIKELKIQSSIKASSLSLYTFKKKRLYFTDAQNLVKKGSDNIFAESIIADKMIFSF